MADATELEYIRTLLGKLHTTATSKHFREAPKIYDGAFAADTERILVYPPELMGVYLDVSIKRYKVKLFTNSEANLMAMVNSIIDGLDLLNRRETITDFTRPSIMLNGTFISGNRIFEKLGNWNQDIILEFEWCTS